MFENPRRGRQARNFTTNAPKILDLKLSSEQIFSRKLPLGAPELRFAMMRNLNCYPTRFKSWNLATASDGQNVTLAGGGLSLLPYRKLTPSGEPVRLIRPETAHECMTHETQKRPRLSLLNPAMWLFYREKV